MDGGSAGQKRKVKLEVIFVWATDCVKLFESLIVRGINRTEKNFVFYLFFHCHIIIEY